MEDELWDIRFLNLPLLMVMIFPFVQCVKGIYLRELTCSPVVGVAECYRLVEIAGLGTTDEGKDVLFSCAPINLCELAVSKFSWRRNKCCSYTPTVLGSLEEQGCGLVDLSVNLDSYGHLELFLVHMMHHPWIMGTVIILYASPWWRPSNVYIASHLIFCWFTLSLLSPHCATQNLNVVWVVNSCDFVFCLFAAPVFHQRIMGMPWIVHPEVSVVNRLSWRRSFSS